MENIIKSDNYNGFRVIRSDLFTEQSAIVLTCIITFINTTYRSNALRNPLLRVGIPDNSVTIGFYGSRQKSKISM